ncbi:MAG: ATP-binding protein [Thiohalobacteraceae bacterium]
MQSIRRKITFGYYLFAACMIGLAMFSYASLRFLEQRLDWGVAVAGFLDMTLEMRRFEKNYFLFGKAEDAAAAQAYAGEALNLLEEHSAAYRELAATAELQQLQDWLERYSLQMARLVHAAGVRTGAHADERAATEADIRELGRRLSAHAEHISAREHEAMREVLGRSRTVLVGLLIAVTLFSLILAHLLTRAVVQPLRRLEQDLQALGRGKLETLPTRSGEREIRSFTQAFNRTLHELELRRRYLVQAEKLASLGTLVSGVAHELNNPLSNISTSTQLLVEELDAADPAQTRAWLRDVEEQTERARHIVATLLDFSRDKPFALQRVSLRSTIDKTLTLLRAQLAAGCEVRVDVPASLRLDADPQKLQQVFVNLIGNAVEAGARRIRVEAPVGATDAMLESYVWTRPPTAAEALDNALFIAVADDGPGIPAEVLPKVFDPFFTTKDVGQGSGLGLYLVQEILQRHGGSIGVASTPGEGSQFLIRLPRTAEDGA